jgi:hypothetical protein
MCTARRTERTHRPLQVCFKCGYRVQQYHPLPQHLLLEQRPSPHFRNFLAYWAGRLGAEPVHLS